MLDYETRDASSFIQKTLNTILVNMYNFTVLTFLSNFKPYTELLFIFCIYIQKVTANLVNSSKPIFLLVTNYYHTSNSYKNCEHEIMMLFAGFSCLKE